MYDNETPFPQLELSVRVINIGPGQTRKIQNDCDILKQYCEFVEIVREYALPGDPDSYQQAIEEAIRRDILKEYLIKNSTEVINMLLTEYDYETDIAVQREEARMEGRAQGREEGREEGIEEGIEEGLVTGRKEKALEMALYLIHQYDETPENAAKNTGAVLDEVLKALK